MLWISDSVIYLGMIMSHLDGFFCASHGHELSIAAEMLYTVSISNLSALKIIKRGGLWFLEEYYIF